MEGQSTNELEQQISARAREIHTDSYTMSIGEMIGLYQQQELDIHPEFQRWFRWKDLQKTRLVESILLGIPMPPVFVAQREDGVWDVVDGLQRLSTIFQFVGVLKNEEGNQIEPLVLQKTSYLPALQDIVWDDPDHRERSLTDAQKMDFKRSRLQITIVKRVSDPDTKYDLFQRLNTGGSQLSDQELRNCILVMQKRAFLEMLKELAALPAFTACVPVTDKQKEEQYDLELVLRFVVLRRADVEELQSIDVGEFLTDRMIALCQDETFDIDAEKEAFRCTFDLLQGACGEESFRRWDEATGRSLGPFSLSAYEVIAIGLGSHCGTGLYTGGVADIRGAVRSIWSNPEYLDRQGSGARASWRLPHLIPLGKRLFSNADTNV